MSNENNLEVVDNQVIETSTGEIVGNHLPILEVVNETDQHVTYRNRETGKFVRKAKYEEYTSFVPKTQEDKIWLLKLIEEDGDVGLPMAQHVGKEIEIEHIITRSYDTIDKDTGEPIFGVLTYLITPDRKQAYVTSSKSVYFTQQRIREMLGSPHEETWENVKVKIDSKKLEQGTQILISLVGF